MAVRKGKRKNKISPKKKKRIPSRSSKKRIKRGKAVRPRRKALKMRPVRKRAQKKPLKKAAKLRRTVTHKKAAPKKKPKKVEELPRKPTEDERRDLRKVLAILSDAYVRQMLIEVGGENALAIVRNFYGNSSDEELAKKLKIKISDVRATLNKLHNEGLVNYIREKDSETGWYSYSWSLNHERMKRWASNQTDKLHILNDNDGNDYYFCPACGAATITNFESAANDDFRCERCNRLLEFIDERRMSELYEKRK